MRRRPPSARAVAAALAALALISCAATPRAVSPETVALAQSVLSKTPPAEPEATPQSGGPRIAEVTLKERDERARLEVEVSYPQIAEPSTPPQRAFNRHVREMLERDLDDFRKFCGKDLKKNGRRADYYFGMSFEVLLATPRLLSVVVTEEVYSGYVNSDYYPLPVNYDLQAGRTLRLSELFRPGSKYLESIAAFSAGELRARGGFCGGTGIDENWLRRGTEPKPENYKGWSLTGRGLRVNFGEYQVAPGCAGLVKVVVPYEHLRDVLRRDGPLASLAPADAAR